MIPTHYESLWTRITQFEMDDPTATIKFSDKLASENNWSIAFTKRVIEEYKRFMFLCTISPTGASPSKIVDEAWHLHLTYTHNYWKKFCKDVLEKDIHHIPSKGGEKEDEHHFDWYGQTLRHYQSVFGEAPPIDIWPPAVERNTERSSIILTGPENNPGYIRSAWILLLPLIVPVFYGKSNPFKLNGPDFLVFYICVFISCLVFLYFVYLHNKETAIESLRNYYDPKASIFQISRFMSGRVRSVQAAIVDLVERKILDAEKDGSFTFLPIAYTYSTEEKNPLVHNFLKAQKEGDRIKYKDVFNYYDSSMTDHVRLAELHLRLNVKDRWQYIALVPPVFFAVPRFFQAYQNDKPVMFLVFLLFFSAVIFSIIYSFIGMNNLANRELNEKYKERQLFAGYSRNSLNDFAFLGVSALGYTYVYTILADTFQNKRGYTDGSGAFVSSDGGSCGSSCGGCGGGD